MVEIIERLIGTVSNDLERPLILTDSVARYLCDSWACFPG